MNNVMIEKIVSQIVIENIKVPMSLEDINLKLKLSDIGVDSITFIQIVVALETEFGIEFDDEDLSYEKFPCLESLISFVKNKIK
jgi:Acyl carrier protein